MKKNKTTKIDERRIINHEWYLKNRQLVMCRAKKWALENPERRREIYIKNDQKPNSKIKKHIWYLEHKQTVLNKSKEWAKNNPEKRKEAALKWARKNYQILKNDISFILDNRIGAVLYKDLRKNKAGKSWRNILDFTLEDLKNHLEKQFTNDMSWEKLSNGQIHIDHIKPRVLFHYESYEDKEFKECWALSNLQPLWAKDNHSKWCHYEGK